MDYHLRNWLGAWFYTKFSQIFSSGSGLGAIQGVMDLEGIHYSGIPVCLYWAPPGQTFYKSEPFNQYGCFWLYNLAIFGPFFLINQNRHANQHPTLISTILGQTPLTASIAFGARQSAISLMSRRRRRGRLWVFWLGPDMPGLIGKIIPITVTGLQNEEGCSIVTCSYLLPVDMFEIEIVKEKNDWRALRWPRTRTVSVVRHDVPPC